MENVEELLKEKEAVEEFRGRKVGSLIWIIEALASMSLTVPEMETVLSTCGLNKDCAIRFGASLKAEREKNHTYWDRPVHP